MTKSVTEPAPGDGRTTGIEDLGVGFNDTIGFLVRYIQLLANLAQTASFGFQVEYFADHFLIYWFRFFLLKMFPL